MSEWISVKERLPSKEECKKYSGWFLVCHKDDTRARMSRYDGHEEERSYEHGWKWCYDVYITHWMPLPSLPENEK